MALEAIGGANQVTGELIRSIVYGGKKAAEFGDILQRVKSVIKLIGPTVHQIKNLSGELDHSNEESEKLIQLFDEGEKLITKYSKPKMWNRGIYADKLTVFYESVRLFFLFHLPLQSVRANGEILTLLQCQLGSRTGAVAVPDKIQTVVSGDSQTQRKVINYMYSGGNLKLDPNAIAKIYENGKLKICDSWEKFEHLGRGSFGNVFKAITPDGCFFAVKEVLLTDEGRDGLQSIDQLQQEISLLSQFQHKHIVQYYGTCKDETKLCIFLELATEGSLLNLYQKHKLSDSQASKYTRQIVKGLKYLHEYNVVHRDIKCANILVDKNGTVKVADFGLAKLCKLNDIKSCKGTAFWMAPEVINKKIRENDGYGFAADIWSLGCTVLEMLTRQHPYSEWEPQVAIYQIGSGVRPDVPDSLMTDAQDFISECLQVDPKLRPTAAQLLNHAFVRRKSQR